MEEIFISPVSDRDVFEQDLATRLAPFRQDGKVSSDSFYQRLGPDEIRILTVQGTTAMLRKGSRNWETVIVCSLSIISFLDAAENEMYLYNALSYAWGSPSTDHYIVCDGWLKQITANLFDALRHLAIDLANKPLPLWVDALCINQADQREKTLQVARMGEIYSRAQSVIVWLGTGNDVYESEFAAFWKHKRLYRGQLQYKSFPSVQVFLDRCHWFQRAWTFQEIVLARKAVVLQGHSYMNWLDFLDAVEIYGIGGEAAQAAKMIALAMYKIRSFGRLMQWSCGRYSSDARDRIYSLLGLYNKLNRDGPNATESSSINIDYGLSPRVVDAQAAVEIIRECGHLGVLKLSVIRVLERDRYSPYQTPDYSVFGWPSFRKRSYSSVFPEFVSWIPEWSKVRSGQVGMSLDSVHRRVFLDMTKVHPSINLKVSLHQDRLSVRGAINKYRTCWWFGDDHKDAEFNCMDGRESLVCLPPCINRDVAQVLREWTSDPNTDPDARAATMLDSTAGQLPARRDLDIYLQLIDHDYGWCTCGSGGRKTIPKHPMPKDAGSQLWEGYKGRKGVSMIWQCVLFGLAEPVMLQPIYDSESKSLTCVLHYRCAETTLEGRAIQALVRGDCCLGALDEPLNLLSLPVTSKQRKTGAPRAWVDLDDFILEDTTYNMSWITADFVLEGNPDRFNTSDRFGHHVV